MRDKWYSVFCSFFIFFMFLIFIQMCSKNRDFSTIEKLEKEADKDIILTPHKKHIDTH